MLTSYTTTELLIAREPLTWRHRSGRHVHGSLGPRWCAERRALALGLLVARAQRRERITPAHLGLNVGDTMPSVNPDEWFQSQDLAEANYRRERRDRV